MYGQITQLIKIGFALCVFACSQVYSAEAKEPAENRFQNLIEKHGLTDKIDLLPEGTIQRLIDGDLNLADFAAVNKLGGGFKVRISMFIKDAKAVEKKPDDELQPTLESHVRAPGLADVSQEQQDEFKQFLQRFGLLAKYEIFSHRGINTIEQFAVLQDSLEEIHEWLQRPPLALVRSALKEARSMQDPVKLAQLDEMDALLVRYDLGANALIVRGMGVTIPMLQQMTDVDIENLKQRLFRMKSVSGDTISFDKLLREIRK